MHTHTSSKGCPWVPHVFSRLQRRAHVCCVHLCAETRRVHACTFSEAACAQTPGSEHMCAFVHTQTRPLPPTTARARASGPPPLRPTEVHSCTYAHVLRDARRAQMPLGMHAHAQSHRGAHSHTHTHTQIYTGSHRRPQLQMHLTTCSEVPMRLPVGGHTSSDPQAMDMCSDPVKCMTLCPHTGEHTQMFRPTRAPTRVLRFT